MATKPQASPPSFYDEIVAEIGGGDPPEKCRHGRYLYCDECVAAVHVLAIAIGRHEGASLAALALAAVAGKAYAAGKDTEANILREQMRELDRVAERYKEQADEERERQGIIKRGRR